MAKVDDGGAAFPQYHEIHRAGAPSDRVWQDGMSLRDYFAAKAMEGACAAESHPESHGLIPLDPAQVERIAKFAWAMADAMLAARQKEIPNG